MYVTAGVLQLWVLWLIFSPIGVEYFFAKFENDSLFGGTKEAAFRKNPKAKKNRKKKQSKKSNFFIKFVFFSFFILCFWIFSKSTVIDDFFLDLSSNSNMVT